MSDAGNLSEKICKHLTQTRVNPTSKITVFISPDFSGDLLTA